MSLSHVLQRPTLANENRASFTNDHWKGIRVKFIAQTTVGGVAFIIWFLACCSYLFGTLYQSNYRANNLHVLVVDYDGGIVGQAMDAAYQQLHGPSFMSLKYHSPQEFPTEDDMYQAVWEGKYWGAVAATKGASARLSAAIQGGSAAANYNTTNALHYIWNQGRYTTFSTSMVHSGMEKLVLGTKAAYQKINGTRALESLDNTDPAAVQAFFNPITASVRNVEPMVFGATIFLNTVSMVVPVLQQFFFLLVLNGVVGQHKLYTKMTVRSSLFVRRVAGLIFAFGAALCQAGFFWAFREDWNANGNQFVLTWMILWLLMHIHLLILDSISTIAPLPAMPFVVLLWVFLNLASTLCPFELMPGFYRWGISLPGHNTYSILITIWTRGSTNDVYRALPIMFAWWIFANALATIALVRACHLAYKFEFMEQDFELHEQDAGKSMPEIKDEVSDPSLSRSTTMDLFHGEDQIQNVVPEQQSPIAPAHRRNMMPGHRHSMLSVHRLSMLSNNRHSMLSNNNRHSMLSSNRHSMLSNNRQSMISNRQSVISEEDAERMFTEWRIVYGPSMSPLV